MDGSRFGQLPAELRNQIYELALPEPKGIPFFSSGDATETWQSRTAYQNIAAFGLPAACRATRSETSKLYFTLNNLSVHCSPREGLEAAVKLSLRRLADWCELVGSERTRELRRVTFNLRYKGWRVDVAISILTEQLARVRKYFHPRASFEVVFLLPIWDGMNMDAPVALVLGDRAASLARLDRLTEQYYTRLYAAGIAQSYRAWAEWMDATDRVRKIITRMPDVS